MMNILLLVIYILSTSSGLVLLKLGSSSGAPVAIINNSLKFNLNPLVLGGIFLYATSFILYTFLISKYNLGFIIPVTTALVYILIFVASFLIFKETFTVIKIVAIALIIFGVILLNLNK